MIRKVTRCPGCGKDLFVHIKEKEDETSYTEEIKSKYCDLCKQKPGHKLVVTIFGQEALD